MIGYSNKEIGDDFLRLKVSESAKDKEWYQYQADRIIPSAQFSNITGIDEMRKMYKLLNNDLSGFEEELKPYCSDLSDYGAVEEELIAYNPLPNKLEQLKGQMLYRGNTYRIMLLNSKAIRSKDESFQNEVRATIEEELQLELQKFQKQLEGMDEQQAAEFVEKLRTKNPLNSLQRRNYLSEAEIIFSKLVQYSEATQDVRSKKMEHLEDAALVSQLYLQNYWDNGKPAVRVLNPLHLGFVKAPNEPKVQKGDYWWYRDNITLADCLDEYINDLSDEDLGKLIQYGQIGNPVTKDHMTRPVFDQTRFYSILERLGENSHLLSDEGLAQGNHLTNLNFNYLVPRIHLEFKAYEEVIFLSYKNELGDKITKQLNSKSKKVVIPDYASKLKFTNRFHKKSHKYVWSADGVDYEAEIMWIPRRYQLTRLGQDIDVDFGKVPFQPEYDNPFKDFELSCKGMMLYNRNAKSLSPVQRTLPYIFHYMSARRIQTREMAKFVGQERVIDVDQVPEDLAKDHGASGDPVLNQEIIARRTGSRFISSSRSVDGLPLPTTRGKGVEYQMVDSSGILMNLESFCNELDRKIGLRMGVTDAQLGNVQSRTTARDNEMSRRSSDIQTSSLYYAIDQVWSHAMNEHLRNLVQLIKGHFREDPTMQDYPLETILPDGSREFFKVTRDSIEELENFGLYHYDTGKEKLYFDYMLNSVFSFAQNAGEGVETVSSVLKALTSTTSVEEMHEIIKKTTDELRQKTMEEMEIRNKQQENAQKMQMQILREQEELRLEGKLVEIDRKAAADLEKSKITSESLANQYDINENQTNDMMEIKREELAFEAVENAKDRKHEKELAKLKNRD